MKYLLSVLLFCLVYGGCNSINNPITNQQIESDIVNQKISVEVLRSWVFEKNEHRCINIVESDYGNDRAIIIADIVTTGNVAGVFVVAGLSGKIALHYSKVGSKWVIDKVENKDFEVDYMMEMGKRTGKSIEEVQAKTFQICQKGFSNQSP